MKIEKIRFFFRLDSSDSSVLLCFFSKDSLLWLLLRLLIE